MLPHVTFSEEQVQEVLSANNLFPLGIGETQYVKALPDASHGVTVRRPMIKINLEEIRQVDFVDQLPCVHILAKLDLVKHVLNLEKRPGNEAKTVVNTKDTCLCHSGKLERSMSLWVV